MILVAPRSDVSAMSVLFSFFVSAVLFLGGSSSVEALDASGAPRLTFSELESLALEDDAQAQFWLADAYIDGRGVAQDDNRAFRWYLSSAENGFVPAMLVASVMYQGGVGVRRDMSLGAAWMGRAAESGDLSAMLAMAAMLESGHGVEKDFESSYSWYAVALSRLVSDSSSAPSDVSSSSLSALSSRIDDVATRMRFLERRMDSSSVASAKRLARSRLSSLGGLDAGD